jgi:predicted MFS family arabinose efflux permease
LNPQENIYVTRKDGVKSLSPWIVFIIAVACGITVANLYWAQPLLDSIAHTFNSTVTMAGLIVTFTQIGYAAGLVLLVPLGDILERRKLIVFVLLFASAALVAASLSGTIMIFMFSSLAIGVTSVVAQILVPFSATLALDHERGKVVGQVMSGLLLGILLARTFSGFISEAFGWRFVFAIAAVLILLLSLLLSRTLPKNKMDTNLTYSKLLKSVWKLVKTEPMLRKRSLYGALVFANFSVLWTSLTFLLARPPYSYSDAVIGLFGLVGASGATAANVAGRLSDKGRTKPATGFFLISVLISFILMAFGGKLLIPLLIGIIILDLGVQGTHILNQSEIYKLKPEVRSRLTTAYMTSFFIGGSIGSATSAVAFSIYGWMGVCLLGGVYSIIAIGIWIKEVI